MEGSSPRWLLLPLLFPLLLRRFMPLHPLRCERGSNTAWEVHPGEGNMHDATQMVPSNMVPKLHGMPSLSCI